jgi:hypothetical protein
MVKLSLKDWVQERLDNCHRLAAQRRGNDRREWLEDAEYFTAILALIKCSTAQRPGVEK